MTTTNPTHLYVGRREALAAELHEGVLIYSGKYLLCPVGDGQWDCEGVNSLKMLDKLIEDYRAYYPGIIVARI